MKKMVIIGQVKRRAWMPGNDNRIGGNSRGWGGLGYVLILKQVKYLIVELVVKLIAGF
jgi:hypothetical protein